MHRINIKNSQQFLTFSGFRRPVAFSVLSVNSRIWYIYIYPKQDCSVLFTREFDIYIPKARLKKKKKRKKEKKFKYFKKFLKIKNKLKTKQKTCTCICTLTCCFLCSFCSVLFTREFDIYIPKARLKKKKKRKKKKNLNILKNF